MESNMELVEVESFYSKIKKVLKNVPWKQICAIAIFFILTYLSTELLNGNFVAFNKIFGLHTTLEERVKYIGEAAYFFLKPVKLIGGIFLFMFSYWIVYGILKKPRLSCFIISLICVLFALINYIVTEARGISLSISDIYSVQTALNVAKGFEININGELIIGVLFFIIANIWLWKFSKIESKEKVFKKNKRAILVILGLVGMFLFYNFKPIINRVELWSINNAYKNYGAGLTIMKMAKNLNVNEPNNYNREDVEMLLGKYTDETINYSGELPNVIVIMNESFSDVANIFNIEVSGDNLSYFHKFMKEENIICGNMHSSKYGGGTSNVEYEFLTQNATAFLPTGSVPYQQYITKEIEQSIVTYMNNLKYNSYGIHAAPQSNYSRGKIYRFLQFKNSRFIDDMENVEYGSNNYALDKYMYNYWINIMNSKAKEEKNFTFLLTIQNHSPYTYTELGLNQYVKNNSDLNYYMQNVSKSDKDLKNLIKFLKGYEEDTILIFFGDHQPNLKLEQTYGSNGKYDSDVSSHIVPFFIWANYDIEEKTGIDTSANYLQSLLLEAAGMPLNQYTQYVSEIRKSIPVITTRYYIGQDGNKYMLDDETSPYYDKLQEYWSVIYYYMFDNQ